MEIDDYFRSLMVLGTLMALLSIVEVVVPFRARVAANRYHLVVNFGLTGLTFFVNFFLNMVLIAGTTWAINQEVGLFQRFSAAPLVTFVLGIVLLDFGTYIAHLLMHKIPFFWHLHLVHHIDPAVDVTTSFRQHPGEGLLRFAMVLGVAMGLGVPLVALALYRTLSAVNALVEHANFRLPIRLDRLVSLVWATPNIHKVHHSVCEKETDSNYGNLLSLFDRGFGTCLEGVGD